MSTIAIVILLVMAYFIGSISTAIIISKALGLPDPRTQGSKNPGASNVLRIGGRKAAAITLIGDTLKGVVPVLIVKWAGGGPAMISLTALAAFLGHLFPIFFRFAGGKGVATLFGCLLALAWQAGLLWAATWLMVAWSFRYASIASLLASLLAPIYMWCFTHNVYYMLVVTTMVILLVFCHHENISNLLAGKEKKISEKGAP